MLRKQPLVNGEYYHVFNKSISGFRIFNYKEEYSRMLNLIQYYQLKNISCSFSTFTKYRDFLEKNINFSNSLDTSEKLVDVIAFCIMPTHIHLILKQNLNNGISIFVGNILNSYARYFNTKLERKGPLWVGRFKNVLVETDEQMLHLTRYVHLNPTTSCLVEKPENWQYSSYKQFLKRDNNNSSLRGIIDMSPGEYKMFVEDQIDYQKSLEKMKYLTLE